MTICCGLRLKRSIYQLLRYSVAFLINCISNGYTLITIRELKQWVFIALNSYVQCMPSHLFVNEHFPLLTFAVDPEVIKECGGGGGGRQTGEQRVHV